jgi:hypothetical protein
MEPQTSNPFKKNYVPDVEHLLRLDGDHISLAQGRSPADAQTSKMHLDPTVKFFVYQFERELRK